MLINDRKKIEDTIYVFDKNFNKNFVKKISKNSICFQNNFKFFLLRKLYIIYLYIVLLAASLFNKVCIYGHDHIYESRIFFWYGLKKYPFYLLEDGTANYYTEEEVLTRSMSFGYKILGFSNRISNIVLTSNNRVDNNIQSKVIRENLLDLWNNKDKGFQEYVCSIYNIDKIKICKYKKCLVTQCFSRNEEMTDNEQILLYRKILENYSPYDIFIKPHPLDIIKYEEYFSEYCIIDKDIPCELLLILFDNLEEIITVNSSVALFCKNSNITVSSYNFEGELYDKVF